MQRIVPCGEKKGIQLKIEMMENPKVVMIDDRVCDTYILYRLSLIVL